MVALIVSYMSANHAQREQFYEDAASDMADCGIAGWAKPFKVGFSTIQAIEAHRNNTHHISLFFTIQSIIQSGQSAMEAVQKITQTGRWMLVIDEYHHYGLDKSWSKAVAELPYVFRLGYVRDAIS